MSFARSVEIIGAGLGGLAAALSFAQAGWRVRVYERSDNLREIGAGLYLKENAVRALENLGVGDEVKVCSHRLKGSDIVDLASGRTLAKAVPDTRLLVVIRTDLHRILAVAARRAGVEIFTGVRATGADPSGKVRFEKRPESEADLIVAADGIHSALRDSIGLTKRLRVFGEGTTRMLVNRTERDSADCAIEYWARRMRVLLTPCSGDMLYVSLKAPEYDVQANRLPVDRRRWSKEFPMLDHVFSRIADDAGVHHTNMSVDTNGWISGRVVLIGDAAHGQPPNLGQGAGLALANSVALVRSLEAHEDIDAALKHWEATWRPIALRIQRWSCWYGHVAYAWPSFLEGLRLPLMRGVGSFGPSRRSFMTLWQGGIDANERRD
jgi:2-polyprenyl-6-methoxyphenol hydroxylase-like FAD-dependent oxidoreductase